MMVSTPLFLLDKQGQSGWINKSPLPQTTHTHNYCNLGKFLSLKTFIQNAFNDYFLSKMKIQ